MDETMKFNNSDSFKYWFYRIGVTDKWSVWDNRREHHIGIFDEKELCFDMLEKSVNSTDFRMDDILTDFLAYTERPEYIVGKKVNWDIPMYDMYNSLINGVCYKLSETDDIAKKYVDRCINWLSSTDFYTAPASTHYHDSEPCGLLKHSLNVVDKMIELLSMPTFSNVDVGRAITTALVHDWCKIDFYEQYMKNVKDESSGVWNKVLAYRCKGSTLPFGHGVTSLFIAQKFFKLNTEQALAIRWHMSGYNTCDRELADLYEANANYPLVHLLQFADQLSTTNWC